MRDARLMRAQPLDIGRLERALDEALRWLRPSRVVISGGEPTLVPNLVELVALLRRLDVGSSLCTNAIRVDAAFATRLRDAGLRSATVGLEGLEHTYAWFRGSHGYERAIRGIAAMAAAGIAVTVNVTLHDRILDEAVGLARRFHGQGLASVSVTSPIAQGRAATGEQLYGRMTEQRVAAFANGLAGHVDCPVSLRIPRCDTPSCPSGRSVFSMTSRGVVSDCPDVGASNVCPHEVVGEPA